MSRLPNFRESLRRRLQALLDAGEGAREALAAAELTRSEIEESLKAMPDDLAQAMRNDVLVELDRETQGHSSSNSNQQLRAAEAGSDSSYDDSTRENDSTAGMSS